MRIGTLVYDEVARRMDICFDIESYYGGLHCGECFDVNVDGEWIPAINIEGITARI